MKYIFTLLLLGATLSLAAQTHSIFIDFGDNDTPSPSPWNNIVTDETMVTEGIPDLTSATGDATGIGFAIDQENNFNQWANTTGAQSTTTEWNFPMTATQDNLFGHGEFWSNCSCTHAEVHADITGLDPNQTYTFVMFGSRNAVEDVRSAQYEFTGATTESADLNASANTENTASVTVQPDANGEIRLVISPAGSNDNGLKFYFLGVMMITWDETTNTLEQPEELSVVKVFPNPAVDQVLVHYPGMRGLMITDVQGRHIRNPEVIQADYQYLDLTNYPSGTYLLTATDENGVIATTKLVKR